jgi:hypothetical protein
VLGAVLVQAYLSGETLLIAGTGVIAMATG